MLHDEAMATLNANAWPVIWADDAGAGLRPCEEIRVRLESLKGNAARRDEVVTSLNATTGMGGMEVVRIDPKNEN